MIKGILIVIYLAFVICLWMFWEEVYGKILSIQLLTLIILLLILLLCFILDNKIEKIIKKLSKNETEIYLSSTIHILIGFLGVIAIIFSVLYGAYLTISTNEPELVKLPSQIIFWFLFSIYFISVMFFYFILPLMKQLSTFRN